MKFLLGTYAYNSHIQNIALALHEADALGAYYTGGVDNYKKAWPQVARRLLGRAMPSFDRELRRRRITTVPDELVYRDWTWELPRTLASRLGLDGRIQDWFWEHSEYHLDRKCARLLKHANFDAFFGVEHGALFSITAARSLGKKSVITFLSPHHAVREHWVDREYEKFPELLTPSTRKLLQLGRRRDARRDREASLADVIHTNSMFTTRSLLAAGFSKEKIITVAYGSPAIPEYPLPTPALQPVRFVYAGPLSVRKGAHYLIEAWQALRSGQSAELHFYGIPLLPKRYFNDCGQNVKFHGSVSQQELFAGYQRSAVLVFPTLCDGFGLVVTEALANGLPVITTPNAGAADLIEEGLNGFLVPAGNVQALAERMEWCIRHPKELLEMRRHALATARRWTWADFRASLRQQLCRTLNVRLEEPVSSDEAPGRYRPLA